MSRANNQDKKPKDGNDNAVLYIALVLAGIVIGALLSGWLHGDVPYWHR